MSRYTHIGLAAAGLAAVAFAVPVRANRTAAQIACAVQENGVAATGTVRVSKGGAEVHSGSCSGGIPLAPGSYSVVIGLDGALDGPEQTFNISLRAGGNEAVTADFATGILQVRIESQGQQAAGMAIIRRDGRQLGTLGSGVAAHLSVGAYDVVARYRLKSQEFAAVAITRAQTTTLDARF